MGDRSSYLRSSSQRSITAFSESFSCGEFGAFDLDYDEDDYEAMAREAENKAQERIHRAKGVIDGLLESDGTGEDDDIATTRQSPPRGGVGLAQMKNSRQNRSKRWEPQKIVEDEGEGGYNDYQDRKSSTCPESSAKILAIRDEEISISNSVLKRKDSNNSVQGKRKDINSCEASVVGSVAAGNSTWENASSPNTIKTDDKSGIVLASEQPVAPSAAIHISAPSVTINYIIEQKVVESRAPAGSIGREVSEMSSTDSYASSDKSRGGNADSVRREEHVPRIKESGVQQTIHENEAPNSFHQTAHENEVPKFVAPAPAMSTQREYVMKGDNLKDPKSQCHYLDRLSKAGGEDFNASQMSMSTIGMSTMGMSTTSLPTSTTSLSNVNFPERSASERNVTKTVNLANKASSQPYDLSELLDSLWSPENSQPLAKPDTAFSSTTPPRSGSSSDGEGSVFTAGVTSFYSAGLGKDANRVSHKDMASLSQIASGRMPTRQTTLKSERDMTTASLKDPVLKPVSSSSGGGGERYDEERPPHPEGGGKDEADIMQNSGLSSKLRSRSRGRAKDHNDASRATSEEGGGGEDYGEKNMRHQSTHEGGREDAQRGKSRSTSRENVVNVPQDGGGDSYDESISIQSQSTSEGEGIYAQESQTRGQQVSFSKAPPNMRDLLQTVESERDLFVYEDMSTTDNPRLQMGVIAENGDGCSVASTAPEYKIDPGVAAFAKSFVEQFSKQEDDKQRRGSIGSSNKLPKEDGSDRSPVEEAARISPKRNNSRRPRATSKNKEGAMQHKNDPKITRSQSRGKGRMHNGVKTHSRGQPQRKERSKSMKMRPLCQSSLEDEDNNRRNSVSLPRPRRPPNGERRHGCDLRDSQTTRNSHFSRDSQSTVPASNKKYFIGDLLKNEKDIIRDTNVEKILSLNVFDYCMVRRSGGRWTYSVVAEVNENAMKFVLDKDGSKKKIERHALLHNVRRLKNYRRA